MRSLVFPKTPVMKIWRRPTGSWPSSFTPIRTLHQEPPMLSKVQVSAEEKGKLFFCELQLQVCCYSEKKKIMVQGQFKNNTLMVVVSCLIRFSLKQGHPPLPVCLEILCWALCLNLWKGFSNCEVQLHRGALQILHGVKRTGACRCFKSYRKLATVVWPADLLYSPNQSAVKESQQWSSGKFMEIIERKHSL